LRGEKIRVRESHMDAVCRDNIDRILSKFKHDPKMHLETVSADDIFSGHEKAILGFVWQVIARFDKSANGIRMSDWLEEKEKLIDEGKEDDVGKDEGNDELDEDIARIKEEFPKPTPPEPTPPAPEPEAEPEPPAPEPEDPNFETAETAAHKGTLLFFESNSKYNLSHASWHHRGKVEVHPEKDVSQHWHLEVCPHTTEGKYYIVSHESFALTVHTGDEISASRERTPYQEWTLIPHGGGNGAAGWYLKGHNGNYLEHRPSMFTSGGDVMMLGRMMGISTNVSMSESTGEFQTWVLNTSTGKKLVSTLGNK